MVYLWLLGLMEENICRNVKEVRNIAVLLRRLDLGG